MIREYTVLFFSQTVSKPCKTTLTVAPRNDSSTRTFAFITSDSSLSSFAFSAPWVSLFKSRPLIPGSFTRFASRTAAICLVASTLSGLTGAKAQTVHTIRFPLASLTSTQSLKIAPFMLSSLAASSRDSLLPVIIQSDESDARVLRTLNRALIPAAATGIHAAHFDSHSRRLVQPIIAINGRGTYAARLTPADIIRLAKDRHILHISPDLPLGKCSDSLDATIGADVALSSYGLSGKGVGVAVIDSGVNLHDDLVMPTTRLAGWVDFVNSRTQPYDDNGHGTHVAGIVAGNGFDATLNHYNTSMTRVAPGARIIGVKVLDKDGSGSVSTVIQGIDWCIANHTSLNIRIINLSLGHGIQESYKTDPLCQACERAWAAGIVVVCAAGNGGRSVPSDQNSPTAYGTIISPGNDPCVITVGAMNTLNTATRTDDKICSFSSRGPSAGDLVLKPDLVAPGNAIESLAVPGGTLALLSPTSLIDPLSYNGSGPRLYMRLSGTSMASPVVAGAAALLLNSDTTLTPDTIKARLMLTAQKVGNSEFISYGAGYLDIIAALKSTATAPLGATSPTLVRNADGTISINNAIWGSNIVWGNNFMWGDNFVANKAIYGSSTLGQNFMWGDNFWTGTITTTATSDKVAETNLELGGDSDYEN